MSLPTGRPRFGLRSRLEHDVDQVLKQLQTSSNSNRRFKSTFEAYQAIQRSNSSLKRQKKKPLEIAIDRVLLFQKQEADDPSDSEAELEEAEAVTVDADERFLLNRQMTKLWHQDTSTFSTADLIDKTPSKKRRLREESEDSPATEMKANDKASADDTALKRENHPARKIQKPSRFTVEYVEEQTPLAGLGNLKDELMGLVWPTLKFPGYYEESGCRPPIGIIITGPRGMGKTALVKNVASALGVPLVSLEMCFMDSERMVKSMTEAFDAAIAQGPSIIFVGEIHKYMGRLGSARHNEYHSKAVVFFKQQMERLRRNCSGDIRPIVIATTSNIAEVEPEILTTRLFEEELEAKLPDHYARREVLETIIGDSAVEDDVDLDEIARITHGFVPAELERMTNNAKRLAIKIVSESDDTEMTTSEVTAAISTMDPEVLRPVRYRMRPKARLSMNDFKTVIKEFVPSLRKEGFTVIPNVTWDQVGALEMARKQLRISIIGPIKQPDVYKEFGLTQHAGILLWGPPGCGKTLIAQAVANDAKASFILINGPELLNKYVGESERAVRELFQKARSSRPCILFFDEMDSVVPPRVNSSTESGARVVNALLTELDGAQDRSGVFVIGTTNRPEMIDEAILRPGRLGTQIFIDLPTPTERVDILQAIYRTRQKEPTGVDLEGLTEVALDPRCTDFSGADLGGLHEKAAHFALERWMQDESSPKKIVRADWEFALNNTKPSVKDPAAYRLRNLV